MITPEMAISAFTMHMSLHFRDGVGRNRYFKRVEYFVHGHRVLIIPHAELIAGVQDLDWINEQLQQAERNYSASLADKLLENI